jgi:Phasin protein
MEEMGDRSQGTKELIASSDVSLRPSQRWHSLARGGPYSRCALRSEGAITARKSPCHETNSSKFPKNCASSPKTMSSTPSTDRAPPGFNEIRERAIKITRENADAAFNLARDVANAKDLHELVTLQTRYVQSQMKLYAQQTQEFGRLMAKALRGAQSSKPGQD